MITNLLGGRKVKLQLVGLDGNAFSIMGAWSQAARRQGISNEDRTKVLDECRTGDYDHLLQTIMEHTEDPDEND